METIHRRVAVVRNVTVLFFLFFSVLANAFCPSQPSNACASPPPPISLGFTVNQSSSVSLALTSISPMNRISGAAFAIQVPQVAATELCLQPSYDLYSETSAVDPDTDTISTDCIFEGTQPSRKFTVATSVQPRGTVTVLQNGRAVGSPLPISGVSGFSFVTPPVQETGQLSFVAEFAADSPFTSATSNTVLVDSVEWGAALYLGSGGSPADRWFISTDVDGDGKADVVKYEPQNGIATAWVSSGHVASVYVGTGGSPRDRWFTTADVNGDGKADLVKYEPGSGYVSTWLWTDSGFVAGSSIYIGSGGSPADRWFTTADVNGDGKADLVKYEPGNGYAAAWLSTGTGFVAGGSIYIGSGGSPADRWFTTVDVNGDRKADFVKYEPNTGNMVPRLQ